MSEDASGGRIIGGLSHASGARLMDPVTIDFDGDGIDDILFGAPGMSPNGNPNAGSVFVVLGKQEKDIAGRIDMTLWKSFDYRFDGSTRNGQLGIRLEAGDFNGDGKADVAIAEPGGNGRIYILYGGKQRDKGIYNITDAGGADLYFSGADNDSSLGIQMCVGDFNHDDVDDIAASFITSTSASNVTSTTTNVALILMRRQWDSRFYSLGSKLYGKTVFSRAVAKNVRALYTCAAGDFDDDGQMDIALGMPLDSFDGNKAAGSVSVVYQPIKYSGTTVNLSEIDPTWGIRIKGSQNGAMFGYSLATGDFTGDGRTDLAVSSPHRLIKGPDHEGSVFIMDANHWPSESGVQSEDLRINGTGGQFGFKLERADANQDGRPDLVISAPYADKVGAPGAGAVSVYLGGPHFVDAVRNGMRPDLQISGDENMNLGFGAAFGDFNGDGKKDVVVRSSVDPDFRPDTGSLIEISDVQRLTPDERLDGVEFRTIAAPSQGGGLSPLVREGTYNGKRYHIWLSEGGLGSRSTLCFMEAENDGRDARLYTPDSCDINIIGPEGHPIRDVLLTSSGDTSLLTIGLPTFRLKKSTGVVSMIELPASIEKPLTLNLTESTLATESISFHLGGEYDTGLGSRIALEDIAGDGRPVLVIGAPERQLDQTAAGSVFLVKDIASRKKGLYDLNQAKDVITFEGVDDERLGSDWQFLDFNLDGHLDFAVLARNTRNTLLEVYSSVYIVYGIDSLGSKAYNITSPEIAPLRVSAPMHKAGLNLVSQRVDLNHDGHDDLVMISPEYRSGLQRKGALYALYSSHDRRSGTLPLNNTALVDFSLVSARNEAITDARFVRTDGSLLLYLVSDSLVTGTSVLRQYVPGENDTFSGNSASSIVKRSGNEIRFGTKANILLLPDAAGRNDETWILFPNAGESQSDQGLARKFVP